eukprot:4389409-Prymnesium_polylepis.1
MSASNSGHVCVSRVYRGKPVRGLTVLGGGRSASLSPGPAPGRGLSTVLPELRRSGSGRLHNRM